MFEPKLREIFSDEDPFALYKRWREEASATEVNDPDAIALATVNSNGLPNVRMVLLRVVEDDGFVFFTNYRSTKGIEITQSGKVAFVSHWKSLRRQVRVRGLISRDETKLSEDYFNQRPLESRIGAWASKQSTVLKSKDILSDRIRDAKEKFGKTPPKPDFWGGFRIKPLEIEFWNDGAYRIHDRFLWKREKIDSPWKIDRLSP